MSEEIKGTEYHKTNHVIIIKTHGRRCIKSAFDLLGYGEHTPKSFSALTLKHKNPSATIIMFSTGNITIMGPKTMWGAIYVLQKLKRKFDLKIIHIKLTNVVVKFSYKNGDMDIAKLYDWDKSNCECDMELFPSCTYMVPNSTVKANFFNSGKVVVTGCSTEAVVENVIKHLLKVIHTFYDDGSKIKVVDKKLVVVNGMTDNKEDEGSEVQQTPNAAN
jgi:TATA-box binding protein (TBP) (component of TFIID and TFIIIB)